MTTTGQFELSRSRPGGNREPRILFLALDIELNRRRGDAIHTRELALHFGSLGSEVCLITATPHDLAPNLGPNVVHRSRTPRSDLSLALWCSRVAREFRADVIYERRYSCKIGLAVKMLRALPLVVEINGLVDEEARIQRRERPPRPPRLRRWWYRRMFGSADGIIAVTDSIKAALVDAHGVPTSRIDVVSNGANTELFRPLDRSACRTALGLKEQPLVCFVGELTPWQGVDVLIRAASILRGQVPPVLVLIVGNGMERDELENLATKLGAPVRFIGPVGYEDVPLYLGASDVAVVPKLPLTSGYSPLKVYESLACGRTVVASRTSGLEFVEARDVGLLVPPGDASALAEAIAQLLADPRRCEDMGARAREVALREYSWRRTAERVLSAVRRFGGFES